MTFVLLPEEALQHNATVGGKAASLAVLSQAGLPVPAWFVISPSAFFESLSLHQQRLWEQADTLEDMQQFINELTLSPRVMSAIIQALHQCHMTEPDCLVAVRSSAVEEDGAQNSFAGMFSSYLGIPLMAIPQYVLQVWRSAFNPETLAYRKAHGLSLKPSIPAVIIQRMVRSSVSGVAFSMDPVAGRMDHCIISAVYGLGTSLVSGEETGDTYLVNNQADIEECQIGIKRTVHALVGQKFTKLQVDAALRDQPILADDEIKSLANMARYCATLFSGVPQDVEWAGDNEGFYVLQSRPITAVHIPEKAVTWGNESLTESWSGRVSPLTYSFARQFYKIVTPQYAAWLGAKPGESIEFPEMMNALVGTFNGQMAWNHEISAHIWAKGKRFNLFDDLVNRWLSGDEWPILLTWQSTLQRAADLVRQSVKMIALYMALPQCNQALVQQANHQADAISRDLTRYPVDQLVHKYRHIEHLLHSEWASAMVTEYFAHLGTKCMDKWLTAWAEPPSDQPNASPMHAVDWLSGHPDMVTTQMTDALWGLAKHVLEYSQSSQMINTLLNGDDTAIDAMLASQVELRAAVDAYLVRYGDRCMEDCKLESHTLIENPVPWLRSVGALALRLQHEPSLMQAKVAHKASLDRTWRLRSGLTAVQRGLFHLVKVATQRMVNDREAMHEVLTRLIARMRWLALEMGHRFVQCGALACEDDVFFLETHEIMGFIEGTLFCPDLKNLVTIRKAYMKALESKPLLPSYIQTNGIAYSQAPIPCVEVSKLNVPPSELPPNQRKGTIGCSGRGVEWVEGTVRLVDKLISNSHVNPGDIVVAQHGDPTMMTLFPNAAGLIFERGNLLSHVVIVAREMHIPTLIAVDNVTQWLKDGDRIRLNAVTGIIEKLSDAAEVMTTV